MRKSSPLAAAALAVGLSLSLTTPAHATGHDNRSAWPGHNNRPVWQGARWLNGQLTDDLLHTTFGQQSYVDYGLSADAALEFAELDMSHRAKRVARALEEHAEDYITGGDPDSVSAGAAAKTAVVAQATSTRRHFDYVRTVTRLEGQVYPTASGVGGRIHDTSSYGDYANTLSQALAARALTRAGSPQAGAVVDYLLQQQGRGGWFQLCFAGWAPAGDDYNCGGDGAPEPTTPDTDATSYALIQLRALPARARTAAVDRAIQRAAGWLKRQQKDNGAWGGGTSTRAANANSTGLAAWALRGTRAARHAAVWLRKHQARDAGRCHTRLHAVHGAVAPTALAWRQGRRYGVKDAATRGQWVRATSQALVALNELPRTHGRISVRTPRHAVRAGKRIRVHVRHAAPYSMVCVRLGRNSVAHRVGARGNTDLWIRVPHGKKHRKLAVVDSDHRRDALRLRIRR